ncbi:hypothetical protein GF373_05685 [bacterium]|nr:hypothetical protein [bacterium]
MAVSLWLAMRLKRVHYSFSTQFLMAILASLLQSLPIRSSYQYRSIHLGAHRPVSHEREVDGGKTEARYGCDSLGYGLYKLYFRDGCRRCATCRDVVFWLFHINGIFA